MSATLPNLTDMCPSSAVQGGGADVVDLIGGNDKFEPKPHLLFYYLDFSWFFSFFPDFSQLFLV